MICRLSIAKCHQWLLPLTIYNYISIIFFCCTVVAKSCLNPCKSFIRTQSKTWIPQQTKLLQTQYRQPIVQNFKLPSAVLLQPKLRQKVNTRLSRSLFATARKPLFTACIRNEVLSREITMVSKKGKRKTCKAVAKRFLRTGKGKLKRWRCGKHHNQSKKSSRRKRSLRKPTYASKTQLKTLNKMLNGW